MGKLNIWIGMKKNNFIMQYLSVSMIIKYLIHHYIKAVFCDDLKSQVITDYITVQDRMEINYQLSF